MSPEYGATCGFFPVDAETLRYLQVTGRDPSLIDIVERYCKTQGLFREDSAPEPQFTDLLALDLGTVETSLAGPRRPHERVPLAGVKASLREAFQEQFREHQTSKERMDWESTAPDKDPPGVTVPIDPAPKEVLVAFNHERETLTHGSVVIAAITSCTNTSNPAVMLAAGLVARNAAERGLEVPPFVKTSLAPGSRAVVDYLRRAELLDDLERLGFNLVGFGCTTCIGNSGPLEPHVAQAVDENGLVVAAVLSGNRNFEGRIHSQVRAAYLASPPLVVAYALAGTVDTDLRRDPLGLDKEGRPVFLADIWPSSREITDAVARAVDSSIFRETYSHIFDGEERWHSLRVPEGALYEWDPNSTYLREPPFVHNLPQEPPALSDIENARCLVMVGDSVTTDHISPAGAIAKNSPAAVYLEERGVSQRDFNSYGSRRGNHEVMLRGTFANIRLRNDMVPDTEGGYTRHLPDGDEMTIYDAAMRYAQEGVPLIVIAGREYGSGSSRDWAAKGTALLGVKAAIAESYERIHRSNLIGMGVLPLEFMPGQGRKTLGLTGHETYALGGLGGVEVGGKVSVRADGKAFEARVRIDSALELRQYQQGGILPLILRQLLATA
jgi:aconitate hydratase